MTDPWTFNSKGARLLRSVTSKGEPVACLEEFTVRPGDYVISDQRYRPIHSVVIHPAGSHPDSPIRNELMAVEAMTDLGSRWVGAESAWIGSDLAVHWTYEQNNLGNHTAAEVMRRYQERSNAQ